MNLKRMGNTAATELTLNDGTVVLFSYSTPVAACLADGSGFVRTKQWWSRTTSKHINGWLAGAHAKEVPQETLDLIAKGGVL